MTAIRIAKEFHLDAVLVHGTEGHRIPDIIQRAGVPIICGPILCDRCKPELRDLEITTPNILYQHGISTFKLPTRSSTPKIFAGCTVMASSAASYGKPPFTASAAVVAKY